MKKNICGYPTRSHSLGCAKRCSLPVARAPLSFPGVKDGEVFSESTAAKRFGSLPTRVDVQVRETCCSIIFTLMKEVVS
jgi:hypothetical protein